jgi:hypothetical protein
MLTCTLTEGGRPRALAVLALMRPKKEGEAGNQIESQKCHRVLAPLANLQQSSRSYEVLVMVD